MITTKPQRPQRVLTRDSLYGQSPPAASPGNHVGSTRSSLDVLIEDDSKGIDEALPNKAIFRNVWHEMVFICVVALAQLMTQANLGNTILVNGVVAQGLGVPVNSVNKSWFVASYSCTVGACVLVTGRLGDLYGRRRLFIIGWLWLAVFNVAIGCCTNQVVYDIFRALSGVGPSLLMPNAAALLGSAWPDTRAKHDTQRKALAFCIFGAVAPAGYIIGGGWGAGIIRNGYRWEWIYWSMGVVSASIAVASWLVIPQSKGLTGRVSGTVDYLGSAVGVTGLVLVFIALNSGPSFGWGAPQTPILLVIGLVLLVLFPFVENRVKDPILPMDIFKSSTFVVVSISLCLGWMSFGMYQFYCPSFLMELRHVSSLGVALRMMPCALIGFVAASASVILLPRVPGYVIFGASMLSFFVGQLLLALTPVDQTYWAMTFPTCLLIGFGPDLSFACASLIASDKLRQDQQGVAGSFINTIVNYSISLGLALAGNVEVHVNDGGKDKLRGFRGAFYLGMGFAGLGIIFTAVFHKGMAKRHKAD